MAEGLGVLAAEAVVAGGEGGEFLLEGERGEGDFDRFEAFLVYLEGAVCRSGACLNLLPDSRVIPSCLQVSGRNFVRVYPRRYYGVRENEFRITLICKATCSHHVQIAVPPAHQEIKLADPFLFWRGDREFRRFDFIAEKPFCCDRC